MNFQIGSITSSKMLHWVSKEPLGGSVFHILPDFREVDDVVKLKIIKIVSEKTINLPEHGFNHEFFSISYDMFSNPIKFDENYIRWGRIQAGDSGHTKKAFVNEITKQCVDYFLGIESKELENIYRFDICARDIISGVRLLEQQYDIIRERTVILAKQQSHLESLIKMGVPDSLTESFNEFMKQFYEAERC